MKREPENGGLGEAFTREHHEIDEGISAYLRDAPGDPRRAAEHLSRALAALRRHIYLEEQIVFPRLDQAPLRMPLMVMYREHGQLWRRMDELDRQLATAGTAPETAGTCRQILELLERHNSKEEPIIYPHLDADLDEDERALARGLLDDGVLPDGWVPREA